MKNTPYFCYREATNMTELEPLLRLRYQVFKEEESTKALFPDNELGMEIDCFDLKSRHFGIYLVMNGQSIPVGYQRIIHEMETPIARTLYRWASAFPELLKKTLKANSLLPLLNHDRSQAVWEFYLDKKAKGVTFNEADAPMLLSVYRSAGLISFILSAGFAVSFFTENCDTVLTTSILNYSPHPGSGLKKITSCVHVKTKNNLTEEQASDLENMIEAFQGAGSICYHPEQPGYYYPPAWFAFAGLSSRKYLPAMLRAAHVHRPMAMAS